MEEVKETSAPITETVYVLFDMTTLPMHTCTPPMHRNNIQNTHTHTQNICLTTSEIHKNIIFAKMRMLDNLRHQLEGGLPVDLWGEGLVGVEGLWIGDCAIVDLVEDVLQEGEDGRGIDAVWGLTT